MWIGIPHFLPTFASFIKKGSEPAPFPSLLNHTQTLTHTLSFFLKLNPTLTLSYSRFYPLNFHHISRRGGPGFVPHTQSHTHTNLTQINLQRVAVPCLLQALDSTLFYLPDTLLGQVVFFTYFFNAWSVITFQPKVGGKYFGLAYAQ